MEDYEKDVLVSKMGKDYGVYFSILAFISRGLTAQNEIDIIAVNDLVFGLSMEDM